MGECNKQEQIDGLILNLVVILVALNQQLHCSIKEIVVSRKLCASIF